MSTDGRKDRIAKAFSDHAGVYDASADVQWTVANRLADRIEQTKLPSFCRVLEIGCGTGFLSMRLQQAFPQGQLLVTDIVPSMLDRTRLRLGEAASYQVMDGERPSGVGGPFDLIASSMTFQWFVDLPGGLARLASLLAPGGHLMFATLGQQTFAEWRAAHSALGLECGTPVYPTMAEFPNVPGFANALQEELIAQPYRDGHDFVRSLKALGASEPAPGHRPLPPGAFRRLLTSLSTEFSATYHMLYGDVSRVAEPAERLPS